LALPHLQVNSILLVLGVVLLGVALVALPWQHVLVVLLGTAAMFALLLYPPLGLVGLAFAVPFGSLRQMSLGPLNVGGADVLIAALAAVWFIRATAGRRIVIPHSPLLVPLLVFLLAISLSMLAATSLELSLKEIIKWGEVVFVYLFMASEVPKSWLPLIVAALLLAATAEAVFGIYQFLWRVGPPGFLLFGRFMRAYGHFEQPNPFAGYMGMSLPLAIALLWVLTPAWRAPVQSPGPQRDQLPLRSAILGRWMPRLASLGSITASLVIGAASVMSWSRGGWVGLVAALVLVTVAQSRSALVLALAATVTVAYVLAVGGVAYLPDTIVRRASDFLPYIAGVDVRVAEVNDANFAVLERMAHWQAAMDMLRDHPLLGVGIGNYAVAYPTYAIGRWQDPLGHAHNYYLNVAAEAGMIGLIAFLFFLGSCFVKVAQAVRRSAGIWRAVCLGALGMLLHLTVHSLFDNLFVHGMHIQVALMLGLVLAAESSVEACHARGH
jgi:putative inorganic carbon (hco3(-)) transporter